MAHLLANEVEARNKIISSPPFGEKKALYVFILCFLNGELNQGHHEKLKDLRPKIQKVLVSKATKHELYLIYVVFNKLN